MGRCVLTAARAKMSAATSAASAPASIMDARAPTVSILVLVDVRHMLPFN